jgi:uncharacterized cupredoxin-like copper-binding protein
MICGSMPRRRAAFPILVVLALALPGCGEEPVRATDGTLEVTLDEYRITPTKVVAPAGELRIVARNDGRLNHNLRVEIPRESPGKRERTIGGTPTARPGTTVSGTVRLAPGTYRLACTIANHDDLGMWGELEVTPR